MIHDRPALLFGSKPPDEVFTEQTVELRRNVLPYSNTRLRLGAGWGVTGPAGTWSIAEKSQLAIVADGSAGTLALRMQPFLPPGRTSRSISVALGNGGVTTRRLSGPENVEIALPSGSARRIDLSIEIEHPDRPVDFGGQDVRPLGVMLSGVMQH